MSLFYVTDAMLTDGVASNFQPEGISFQKASLPLVFGFDPVAHAMTVAPAGDPAATADRFVAGAYTLTGGDDVFVMGPGVPYTITIRREGGDDYIRNSDSNYATEIEGARATTS